MKRNLENNGNTNRQLFPQVYETYLFILKSFDFEFIYYESLEKFIFILEFVLKLFFL